MHPLALPKHELTGSEKVYWILSQLMEGDDRLHDAVTPEDSIIRRFVIDILSGSSAGRIKGLFLAKAGAPRSPSVGSPHPDWARECR